MKYLLSEKKIDELVSDNENISDNGTPENCFNEFVAGKVVIATAEKIRDWIKEKHRPEISSDTFIISFEQWQALNKEIEKAKKIYY